MDEIQSGVCKSQVRHYQQLAAEDIRFDIPLADACYEDRQKLCANVPPVRPFEIIFCSLCAVPTVCWACFSLCKVYSVC